MITTLNLKRFAYLIEIVLSFFLATYFFLKIFNTLYSNVRCPSIIFNTKEIYLKGTLHEPDDGFFNLASFDYTDFMKDYPYWDKSTVSHLIRSHSLVVTHYNLKEFTNLLLRLHFPYWQKGGVKMSIKVRNEWIPLDNIVDFSQEYSLEDILFLGLGMSGMNFKGISASDFIRAYFKDKNIKFKKSIVSKLLGSPNVVVKIELNEKN